MTWIRAHRGISGTVSIGGRPRHGDRRSHSLRVEPLYMGIVWRDKSYEW